MPFEVGISSGIMGAAPVEERVMYTSLARKAYYAITQGVKFIGDEEANRYVSRAMRAPYCI